MTVITVTADNQRLEDAESASGWANIGGGQGGAAEPSFAYQGTNLFNRKVTSSTGAGFYYDPTTDGGSSVNMASGTNQHLMCKCIVTDYSGLQTTNGVRIRIGSGTNAYNEYIIAGSNSPLPALAEYPAKGGLIIVPINPNNIFTTYIDSTTGSPNLAATDYFGIVGAFSNSTAKSENVGLDALDIGTGLALSGGGGVDPIASFTDFYDFDEGTTNNRFGFVTKANTILNCFGRLRIGFSGTTKFTDTSSILVFPDGMFDSGFSKIDISLSYAGTDVNISSNITSLGTDVEVNTRADFIVGGVSGVFTFDGVLNNFRSISFTSTCTILNAIIECNALTQSTASITNTKIITLTSTINFGCITDPVFDTNNGLSDSEFIQNGTAHAIKITATNTSYDLTNITFTGYGADTTDDSAIYFSATTGTVTLNILGGDIPTYKSAGATVVIQSSYTLTLTDIPTGTQVTIVNSSTRTELQNTPSSSGDVTYTHGGGETVDILLMSTAIDPDAMSTYGLTLPSADSSVQYKDVQDRNYDNPV